MSHFISHPLYVKYVGEEGVVVGGVRWDFLTLMLDQIESRFHEIIQCSWILMNLDEIFMNPFLIFRKGVKCHQFSINKRLFAYGLFCGKLKILILSLSRWSVLFIFLIWICVLQVDLASPWRLLRQMTSTHSSGVQRAESSIFSNRKQKLSVVAQSKIDY